MVCCGYGGYGGTVAPLVVHRPDEPVAQDHASGSEDEPKNPEKLRLKKFG